MRNLFDGSRRGRRPDRPGSVPIDSSPYDFGTADDERVDPVDLMAIRADDELLDALASGGGFGGYGSAGFERGGFESGDLDGIDLDGGFQDDQQMLAMLAAWRDEVVDEPIPELLTTEQASEAIVAGQRSAYPKRRLMPVAAAAAAVVLGMSGVAIGAGAAEPGDALWGVSRTLDSDRADSKEAAQRVSVALASVQQALDQGRVKDAQATLASIAPELNKVTDEDTKRELSSKQANLIESAGDAEEGEKVSTDESGKRKDHDKDKDKKSDSDKDSDKGDKDKDKAGAGKPDPRSADPAKGPDPASQSSSSSPDPRREQKPSDSSSAARPAPESSKPEPHKPSESKKPEPSKPSESKKPESEKPDKVEDKKGEGEEKKDESKKGEDKKGEGEGEPENLKPSTSTPNAMVPPVGPPAFGSP
jgi:hypothetical protein